MRLIDADRIIYHEIDEIGGEFEPYIGCSKSQIDNLPTVEAIPKADYETRLKADLEAILVDLQLEIEEKEQYYQDKFLESENGVHDLMMGGRMYGCGVCKELIQQKINSSKAENEVKND